MLWPRQLSRRTSESAVGAQSTSTTKSDANAGTSASTGIPLAHAQLVIARAYGLYELPRPVHYTRDAERLSYNPNCAHAADFQHDDVRLSLESHRNRRLMTGRILVAYLPQLPLLFFTPISRLDRERFHADVVNACSRRMSGWSTRQLLCIQRVKQSLTRQQQCQVHFNFRPAE